MATRIRVLDEHTINKIAAGEVIENPASVVKELVENSIDAGANDIYVEIVQGGRRSIRISDNGCGMEKDDALLCMERHATSKIREVEDIHSINSMGFRGEAIPSIASISKFILMTCPKEIPGNPNPVLGTMIIAEGGRILNCDPVAHSQGTTIEVNSLFFNVPARRKFQKSPAYNTNEIHKLMSSLALGYPFIKFQLVSDQQILLTTQTSTNSSFHKQLSLRIKDILGADYQEATKSIDVTNGTFSLQGVIGLPAYSRPNRTGQYLFINQRAVVSPTVSYAVRDAYGPTLPNNRHPVFVLHLTIPGSYVDVNVHPQKKEVRLRQEQEIKSLITANISRIIYQNDTPVSAAPTTFSKQPLFEPESQPAYKSFESSPIFKADCDFLSDLDSVTAVIPEDHSPKSRSPTIPELPFVFQEVRKEAERPILPKAVPVTSPRVLMTIKQFFILDASTLPKPSEGLCLMDQRAAHSRVIFEKLIAQDMGQNIAMQSLLIPYNFETVFSEKAVLSLNLDGLNSLGISIHQIGPQTFSLDAIPASFGNIELESLVKELLAYLIERRDMRHFSQDNLKAISLVASRAAVSRNSHLSIGEAQSLVNQLMQCQMPYICPKGRSTIIQMSRDELEKRFLKDNQGTV